ncbi:MaoC/PaaZ C-terminal domain-containing protein [Mycobacterium paraintracellulare]|uniref:MaoC/PaaZ C-terminal domain-containing protein n=1 Tax=Mycobacterium paraintracellulare TaxID=1138383 RepID=UPI001EEDA397|nr:MaoC/PaaZ C-terminal domain-containing protein [Mycobacterium paraintracellulare]WVL48090.1 MaoC/PaaZ C-terminal domain-containing protein [Mycobacterium paraintracellulare]
MSPGDGAGGQITTTTASGVGVQAPVREFGPLTRQMFVRYAGASGDFNPMHYDDQLARSAGYPSVFAQGMFCAALLAGFATDWLGAGSVRRFGVRFREQVWPGDVLTCSGTVTAVTAEPDAERVIVELTATRQTGGVAITGTAEFVNPRNAARCGAGDADRP